MRKIVKRFVSLFLVPLTRWYLRKERRYTYEETTVRVLPGVFHPGLFYSTKLLIGFLREQDLAGQSLLELGCGTGLISVLAAKKGAHVTSSDLSKSAIENAIQNARDNNVSISVVYSDLFERIDQKPFDWIIINPPYYAKRPSKDEDLAWYCGENFEYFQKLFAQLGKYMHSDTQTIMVLTKGSDVEKIITLARDQHFEFILIKEKPVFFDEKDFLFRVEYKVS